MNHPAYQMGALACECDLTRDKNPFDPDTQDEQHMAWEEGYTKAVHQWRAAQRAEIADRYGDEAADEF